MAKLMCNRTTYCPHTGKMIATKGKVYALVYDDEQTISADDGMAYAIKGTVDLTSNFDTLPDFNVRDEGSGSGMSVEVVSDSSSPCFNTFRFGALKCSGKNNKYNIHLQNERPLYWSTISEANLIAMRDAINYALEQGAKRK